MSLAEGKHIGPYEIVGALGAGGMGEVYQARDPRLDRSVAIKALPQGLAKDGERLARFEREARLLASLNHANVGAIYGLEEVDGTPYLVLEFLDGETLADRLARGPLPVKDALDVGIQVAAAIEAAHARDIVHRDLKPTNIMLTESRTVKVLDFGLAKDTNAAAASAHDLSASPTLAMGATGAGLILGTAAYMSPEQARGKPVDGRTDIWALGCVLFESLTGKQVFAGETVSDIIARILEREPDWEALPEEVPQGLHDLISRCLAKDVTARPGDAGQVQRELDALRQELASGATAPRKAEARKVPSLAVLYFENLANDPDSEYFCSGITEDILTDLSKIKGLRVASRNAVGRFRGKDPDIAEVAGELKVDAVMQGSVRRAGDRVRITVQLINGSDGFQMWAERYDRTLDDVFAVQEEIASAITDALRVTLTKDEAENLVQNRPKDAQAYDLYLRGYAEYMKYTDESLKEAIRLFNRAIELDPGYALAYAGLADSYGQQVLRVEVGDAEALLEKAFASAEKAIALNPRLPAAYKAQALIATMRGEMESAMASLTKALDVDPHFAPALINLGILRFISGDLAGGERLNRRVDADGEENFFGLAWLSFWLLITGRPADALATVERVRASSPTAFLLTNTTPTGVMAALALGDSEKAESLVKTGFASGVDDDALLGSKALLAASAGRIDEARAAVTDLLSVRTNDGLSVVAGAHAAMQLDMPDVALKLMTVKSIVTVNGMIVRLMPVFHGLLKYDELQPRRSKLTLVWPLEAPMMDSRVHALFADVRIESGRPEASDIVPL